MSSDSVHIENPSTTENLSSTSTTNSNEPYSSSVDISSPSLSTKNSSENVKSSTTNRKDSTAKLPYPVISDHRDPSTILVLLQKETQGTSKKILEVVQQIETCEKRLSSNSLSDQTIKSLKYERVKLKQQLDALKKHERRVNLQIDFITTKIEIKGLEDERKQVINDENKQINILLGKLKQKLDKMKIYMRTRNEQMKQETNGKQQSSNSNVSRQQLSTSQKPQQQQRLSSSDPNQKRPLSSSTQSSHSTKRLRPTGHSQTKPPIVRLTSRLSTHQSQSHSVRTPTVRFLNKTSGSSMTALNSSSPATPASSSSTLSPPINSNISITDTNSSKISLQQIDIPSIDEDDEINIDLDIDELFNDDPYSEENIEGFKSEARHHKTNQDIKKKESY